tara:strand:+ start:158 stop:511 length:354 start_codon:yes stop_codon:yes gene_type:complete
MRMGNLHKQIFIVLEELLELLSPNKQLVEVFAIDLIFNKIHGMKNQKIPGEGQDLIVKMKMLVVTHLLEKGEVCGRSSAEEVGPLLIKESQIAEVILMINPDHHPLQGGFPIGGVLL